jgi:hypothetical protein
MKQLLETTFNKIDLINKETQQQQQEEEIKEQKNMKKVQ